MLGGSLQSGGQPEKCVLRQRAGENVRDLRLAGGQSAGLIQHHRIHPVQVFQCLGILEQHAQLSAPACAHHDGNRRCQSQGAGTGNDQHGHRAVQTEFQSVAQNHPHAEGHRRNGHDHGNEHTGNFIRQPGNGSLGAAGLLHHVDDLRQGGVLSHLVRPEFQIALGIDGGGADPVPRLLLHGNAFAGKGALVNAGPAGEHRAVYGDGAAGADDHRVAHLHLLHGNGELCPVPADGGGFGA